MSSICFDCAACETDRCPRRGDDLNVVEYGCLNFIKLPVINNPEKHATRCGECRFLFQKPRKDAKNKSYVQCGAVSSIVRRIKPSLNCPYFKPLRKKQLFRRKKRSAKRAQEQSRNNSRGHNSSYGRSGSQRYGREGQYNRRWNQ